MPQLTFKEARRLVEREGEPPEMVAEFDRKVAEATERMKALQQAQRERLERELERLVQAAQTNRDALAKAGEDRIAKRITAGQLKAKATKLAQDQRVVMAKAERVKERIEILDQRESNAPEALDRIAQTTGMGKLDFNF